MKNILKNQKTERAIKTFIEAFASYIAVNIMLVDISSKTAIYALIAGAIGSAISVLLKSSIIKKVYKANEQSIMAVCHNCKQPCCFRNSTLVIYISKRLSISSSAFKILLIQIHLKGCIKTFILTQPFYHIIIIFLLRKDSHKKSEEPMPL